MDCIHQIPKMKVSLPVQSAGRTKPPLARCTVDEIQDSKVRVGGERTFGSSEIESHVD